MKNNELEVTRDFYIGKVMKSDPVTRKVYCFIPRFMMGLSETNVYSKTLASKKNNIKNLNELNVSDTITKTNIFAVLPRSVDEPLPKPGSLVYIWFIDSFENCYWEKYNNNGKYEVIDEEKYPKLYSLSINDKEIDINNSDKINIVIPDDFKVILEEDKENKIKQLKLEYNSENGYTIDELRDYVKLLNNNMLYLIKKYRSDATTTIKNALTTNALTNISIISNKISNDIEIISESIDINEIEDYKLKDIDLMRYYNEAQTYYENFITWSNSHPNAYNQYIPSIEYATTLYNSYKADADNYELSTNNIKNIKDMLSIKKTINYYLDNQFVDSVEFDLLSSIKNLPTSIAESLIIETGSEDDEYMQDEQIKYSRLFEHLYEDSDFTIQLEETAQRNIDAYIGVIEAMVTKNRESSEDTASYIVITAPQAFNKTTTTVNTTGVEAMELEEDSVSADKTLVYKTNLEEGSSVSFSIVLKNGFTGNFNIII